MSSVIRPRVRGRSRTFEDRLPEALRFGGRFDAEHDRQRLPESPIDGGDFGRAPLPRVATHQAAIAPLRQRLGVDAAAIEMLGRVRIGRLERRGHAFDQSREDIAQPETGRGAPGFVLVVRQQRPPVEFERPPTIPVVRALGKPLEYLASTPGGMKAYEALFELEASGTEFNLACILIGLEPDPQQPSWRQFRETPRLRGRPLSISVAWTDAGRRRELPAAEALLGADAGVDASTVQWVYVGSPASEVHGRFAAEETGTLIGFIHDANSIIESVAAIGVGAYGSVRGNDKLLPPNGSAIELIVAAPAAAR